MTVERLIGRGGGRMRVELDRKALFALASDSRLEILKAMQPMRRTVSQLAECLGIDKAAVHRHLKTLEEGGFVKRYDDHGFVYYGLSWKARDLLSPRDNTRVVIVLASTIAMTAVVVFLSLFILLAPDNATTLIPGKGDPPEDQPYTWDPELVFGSTVIFWMFYATTVVSLTVLALATLKSIRRPRQPGAQIDAGPELDGDELPDVIEDRISQDASDDGRRTSEPRS